MTFTKDSVLTDPVAEIDRITDSLRRLVRKEIRKGGGVVGISGGVDSSVVLGLCARAFGPNRVVAVMLPEKDSDPESERLARLAAAAFGVEPVLENISPALEGFGCYRRRDEAIRRVFPEYDAELHNYAVIGTANKNEHDQGFFVKYGDGGVDVKALGHLFKTQVYQLAECLGVPAEIRSRPPTTDTYSAAQTQEEFF